MSPCRWDHLFILREDVRRMASEDSDQLRSGLLVVHRLHDLDDVGQPASREVMAGRTEIHALSKLQKVSLLFSAQRVCHEERNDHLTEIKPIRHDVPPQIFFVVVEAPVEAKRTHSEELSQPFQGVQASGALHDHERVTYLPPGPVAFAVHSPSLTCQTNGEATLSVYKTK